MVSNVAISLKEVGVFYQRFRRSVHGVRQAYWALKNISVDVIQGECLGIIGRNGAGKSTLLRVLAGIIKTDRGMVSHHGVLHASLLSLQVGMVEDLSGKENVILTGLLQGLSRKYIEERLSSIIEYSGLGDFINEPVSIYSAGMRTRLGFSVATQINPDLLLIDEALSVGDQDFKKKSQKSIHDKIKSDTTVVLVSHSSVMVRELCDRVMWIDQGLVRMIGTTSEVMDEYEKV